MTHLGASDVVKPQSGPVVVVPLPLCPWYLQSIVMYMKYWSCNFARAGIGVAAVLLREPRSRQAVNLPIAPRALEGVRVLKRRTGGLP